MKDRLERLFETEKEALAERRGRTGAILANQIGSTVGSPGEAMQKRLREMVALVLPEYDLSRWFVMDAGDLSSGGAMDGVDVGLSLPVASDIWYLGLGASILPIYGG